MSVLLDSFPEVDLLQPGDLRCGGRSELTKSESAATNVWLHADVTQKQVAIDGATVPGRPEKVSAYRVPGAFVPVLEASEYADRLRRVIALSRNFSHRSA